MMVAVHLTAPPYLPFPPPLVPSQNGLTPLHKAADNGHTEVVKMLLAAGASKDIAEKQVSLLWLAAPTAGGNRAERACVRVCVSVGIHPYGTDRGAGAGRGGGREGGTHGQQVGSASRVRDASLLAVPWCTSTLTCRRPTHHSFASSSSNNACSAPHRPFRLPFPPPLVPCQNGETPLHKAADRGYIEVVEVLLAAGADKDIADKVSRWLVAPTIGGSKAERGDGGKAVLTV